jgi:DNA-binding NarL/FixJ family response regulator
MSTLELRRKIDGIRHGMNADELELLKQDLISALENCENRGWSVDTDTAHARLSRREKEVMSMMLEGQRLKEIAARLDISVKTVTTHRSRLMKKLRVEDNLQLYRYGIRNGLISV